MPRRRQVPSLNSHYTIDILYSDPAKDEYKRYPGKRLANFIKTVVTPSKLGCMMLCSTTNGCLAVNIIGNHDITCELTPGLSDENEMQDDHNSQLFVLGN